MEESIYFNASAERQVLGLAINYEECVRPTTDLNRAELYFKDHQIVHEAICALAAERKQPDMVTVVDWLTKKNQIEAIGGISYIMQLCTDAFLPSLQKQYLAIVHECYSRRKQREVAKEYAAKLDSGEDTEETREWMLRQMTEIKEIRNNGLIPILDAAIKTMDVLGEDQKKEDQPTNRILSGISTMDNKLGGLRGSEYVAIGARPSVGKSIFALTYCINAAKQGKRVLLVSLEMDEVSITERVIASQGGGTLNEITSGNISEKGWEDIARSLKPISELSLWYSTTANTVEKVRRCAYELYEKGGIDLIAIDYIQLMEVQNPNARINRQEEISRISRGLRMLAAELKIPILVLTQLNRSSTKGQMIKGKKVRTEPTMSEARESGAIEQDANIFMLLHDPDESEMRNEEEKEMYRSLKAQGLQMMRIIIDKNRQGKRGRVTLAFDGDHMRFLPIARNVEAPF